MKLFTIGFTKKSARTFFELIRASRATRVLDVRLNNVSQLAGFAKKDDLAYFLGELCSADYAHRSELAPTREMLDDYKKRRGDWSTYERRFLELMQQRQIEKSLPKELIDNSCLLCSEDAPHHCHRRLVAEYLQRQWGDIDIVHLEQTHSNSRPLHSE